MLTTVSSGSDHESRQAPSLWRRLVQRSGAMTFEEAEEATTQPDDAKPNLRLRRVATLVARYAPEGERAGDVLDIGCWTGGLGRILAGMSRCTYTGVDIEPAARAVEAARRAMPDGRFLVVPSVETLPFEAQSFDVVVLTEVIEHVPAGREGPLLRELARVLRPNGSVIFSTPYHNALTPLDPAWFFGHRHYSVGRVAALSRGAGLSLRDIRFTGGFWFTVDTNLLYVYKHILHRPYATYPWLRRLVEREYRPSPRGTLATTLWCRMVRSR